MRGGGPSRRNIFRIILLSHQHQCNGLMVLPFIVFRWNNRCTYQFDLFLLRGVSRKIFMTSVFTFINVLFTCFSGVMLVIQPVIFQKRFFSNRNASGSNFQMVLREIICFIIRFVCCNCVRGCDPYPRGGYRRRYSTSSGTMCRLRKNEIFFCSAIVL